MMQQQQQHSCTDPFAVSPRLASPHPAFLPSASGGQACTAQRGKASQRRISENSNKHQNQKKAQGKSTSARALNHGETSPTPLYLSEYSDPAGRSDLHCCRRLPHFTPSNGHLLFDFCFRRLLLPLCMLVASGLDSVPEGITRCGGAKLDRAGRPASSTTGHRLPNL